MLKSALGVGPTSAHATLAAMSDSAMFKSGRGLDRPDAAQELDRRQAAPRLHHQAGQQALQRLLVFGVTAWLRQAEKRPEKVSCWLRFSVVLSHAE
jgi:hypothetical protein